jgi:CofD-related protein of GAK system
LPDIQTDLPGTAKKYTQRGRRLVFFTGGTALREVSRELARHTEDSAHLVTTFDSGGSSAALRRAFAMPAVGDIRNRLLALAHPSIPEGVLDFCSARLPEDAPQDELRRELLGCGDEAHPVWRTMSLDFAGPLRDLLRCFLERMPRDFDPRRAAYGNLALAGGYLRYKRDFGPVLAVFSRLLRLRGVVEPIVKESLHLAAQLDNDEVVSGQHYFRSLTRPVRRVFLSVHEPWKSSAPSVPEAPPVSCRPPLAAPAAALLESPRAVIYPMGSFYSSLLATLLPRGVGSAIARADCPKIFIPNTGDDSESRGLSLVGQCRALLGYLGKDTERKGDFLRYVLVDSRNGRYHGLGPQTRKELAALGVELVDENMVCPDNPQRHDPQRTVDALLRLAA